MFIARVNFARPALSLRAHFRYFAAAASAHDEGMAIAAFYFMPRWQSGWARDERAIDSDITEVSRRDYYADIQIFIMRVDAAQFRASHYAAPHFRASRR